MPDAGGIGSPVEGTPPEVERFSRVLRDAWHAQPCHPIEVAIPAKDPQVRRLRGYSWQWREMEAVVGHRGLRVLRVAVLAKPFCGLVGIFRPLLTVCPHSVDVENELLSLLVHQHIRRGHV